MTEHQEAITCAINHFRAGRVSEGVVACQQILRADPNCVEAWETLGIVAYQQGQFDASAHCFQSASNLRPLDAGFHNNFGLALQSLRQLDRAAAEYRQALRIDPNCAGAHDNLGNVCRDLGRLEESVACHRRALELQPRSPVFLSNLGSSYQSQGKTAEAIACFQQALALEPAYASAFNNLGIAQQALGDLAAAIVSFRRAVELEPNLAQAHYNLGSLLSQEGDWDLAISHLNKAIELNPQFAIAISNLGTTLAVLGRLPEAIEQYRRALALEPNSAVAHERLGNALRAQGRYADAQICFERALALQPDLASAHVQLGGVFQAERQLSKAIACYRRGIELDPQSAFGHTNLAQALLTIGEADLAWNHLRQAIEIQPEGVTAYYAVANYIPRHLDEPMLRRLESLCETKSLPPADRSLANFALAAAYDRSGEYKRAFGFAERANGLKKNLFEQRGHAYHRQSQSAFVDHLLETWSADSFRADTPQGVSSELPIFVVGMPRSGTSLVEQILASHPEVFGAGELDDVEQMVSQLPAIDARAWAQSHLTRLRELGGPASRVVDKMPLNFRHLGLLAKLFPQARIIHCRRDVRDVCLSCYLQNFTDDGLSFAFDLDDIAHYYREYERLMAHWRRVLPRPMFEVTYEELVHDQERVSRDLVAFCGLEWDEHCLNFHRTKRCVTSASMMQVRQSMYRHSVHRWRHYAGHLPSIIATLHLPLPETELGALYTNPTRSEGDAQLDRPTATLPRWRFGLVWPLTSNWTVVQ